MRRQGGCIGQLQDVLAIHLNVIGRALNGTAWCASGLAVSNLNEV
jgi:hypothetical protein